MYINIEVVMIGGDTPSVKKIDLLISKTVDKIIQDAIEMVDDRFISKKSFLDEKGLDSQAYYDALDILNDEKKRDFALIHIYSDNIDMMEDSQNTLKEYLEDFANDFYSFFQEYYMDGDLGDEEILDMFSKIFNEFIITKFKIADNEHEKEIPKKISVYNRVEHENQDRIIWTQAHDELTTHFREQLNIIFAPLLQKKQSKVNFYFKEGANRAVEGGGILSENHFPMILYENLSSYFEDLFFFSSYEDSKTFENIIWSVFSQQYAQNKDNQDIDIYLPEGEITTSSIFWNFELNITRLMNNDDEKFNKINFHQLTHESKQELQNIKTELKHIEALLKKHSETIERLEVLKKIEYTPEIDQQYKAVTPEMEKLNKKWYKLDHKKSIICGDEKNWEPVDFESLKFSGLHSSAKKLTSHAKEKLRALKSDLQDIKILIDKARADISALKSDDNQNANLELAALHTRETDLISQRSQLRDEKLALLSDKKSWEKAKLSVGDLKRMSTRFKKNTAILSKRRQEADATTKSKENLSHNHKKPR